jgi:hypothetical protein
LLSSLLAWRSEDREYDAGVVFDRAPSVCIDAMDTYKRANADILDTRA